MMVGTRWNVLDLGEYRNNAKTILAMLQSNARFERKGESNFVYDYGVGFTTEYYNDMKEY